MIASPELLTPVPPRVGPQLRGFGVAGSCRGAAEASGDFFDVLALSDGLLLLAIADVMGKGLPAALFAGSLRTLLRAVANPWTGPARLLAELNDLMFDDLSNADVFITLQLVRADLHRRTLTVANAGHCPLLVCDAMGQASAVAPDGMPLGIQADAGFVDEPVAFPRFGSVLLYTDGVTEAPNMAGRLFGQSRLENWLSRGVRTRRTANQLKASLLTELLTFQDNQAPPDDQTFLILSDESPHPVVQLPVDLFSATAQLARFVPAIAASNRP